MGRHILWTEELDKILKTGIREGKGLMAIAISLKTSETTIKRRIKDLGYNNLRDARLLLANSQKKHML